MNQMYFDEKWEDFLEYYSFIDNKEYYTNKSELVQVFRVKQMVEHYFKNKGDKNMELKDTVEMMQSDDFKERFRAEYFQTKIRYDKLDEMTVCYEAGTLPFTPNCSLELLKEQKKHMGNYIRCLKVRAQIENIDLREVK